MFWDATRTGMFASWVIALAFAHTLADEPIPTTPAAATSTRDNPANALADVPVPEAFSKDSPADLNDLRAMESHVRMLIDRLRECTVSVQIGRAQGSGVIVSADGYILTAAHVIGRPGRRCSIVLSSGRRVEGVTLGSDRTLDAGMIQIDDQNFRGKEWPHAEMAPLSSIDPGNWCLAFGHPGGFDKQRGSVTRLGRVIYVSPRVVQTDCELVGGDSGGPLFDMNGRVIGINSRIQEETFKNYHVPVSVYGEAWDRLAAGESYATHSGAFMGVSGNPSPEGLRVTKVWTGGSAAAAGIKVGDVIRAFSNRRIDTIDTLKELVGQWPPGESVKVEVLRDGRPMTLTVRLRHRDD